MQAPHFNLSRARCTATRSSSRRIPVTTITSLTPSSPSLGPGRASMTMHFRKIVRRFQTLPRTNFPMMRLGIWQHRRSICRCLTRFPISPGLTRLSRILAQLSILAIGSNGSTTFATRITKRGSTRKLFPTARRRWRTIQGTCWPDTGAGSSIRNLETWTPR